MHVCRILPGVPEDTSPHLQLGAQDQRLGAGQDQLPCGTTGTSSGNRQETETCMVVACHTPRQPFKAIPQDTFKGGRRLGQWGKCLLDNIKEWTSLPLPEVHKGLLQKRLEEDLC